MLVFTTLYFSERFTMPSNLIVMKSLKNIYRTYCMPGAMQNAGEALGSKASMASPQEQTYREKESTWPGVDPELL